MQKNQSYGKRSDVIVRPKFIPKSLDDKFAETVVWKTEHNHSPKKHIEKENYIDLMGKEINKIYIHSQTNLPTTILNI